MAKSAIDTTQEYEAHRGIVLDLRGRIPPQISDIDSRVGIRVLRSVGGLAEMSFDNQIGDFDALCKDRQFSLAVTAATNYTWNPIKRNMAVLKIVEDLEAVLSTQPSF